MPSAHHLLHRHFNSHTHGLHHRSEPQSPEAFLHRQVVNIDQALSSLDRRDDDTITTDDDGDLMSGSDHMVNLSLVILGTIFMCLAIVSLLYVLRRSKKQATTVITAEKGDLPAYTETTRNPHNLTIETTHNGHSSVVVIGQDGRPMLQNPNSAPNSPDNVPEIRITFPDEQDADGQSQKGRVLIVRVGDNASVGLEPVQEEQLPAYEKDSKSQFYSIDMNQIGGLKDEKDRTVFK